MGLRNPPRPWIKNSRRSNNVKQNPLILAWLLVGVSLKAWALEAPVPPLIQIGVEVVEVNELKTRTLGIEWLNTIHLEELAVPSVLKVGTFTRDKIFGDLQALMENGAADLLANPKLVTRDCSTATFHAGGELPYPIARDRDSVDVEFKPYGVKLNIQPKIQANGAIALNVDAEVSDIDMQNAVTFGASVLPGIRIRRVTSELTLMPGTTLTLAGMIQTKKEWKRRGVPGLMNIPVLGYLFSRKMEEQRRTSIVVFITPVVLEAESLHARL